MSKYLLLLSAYVHLRPVLTQVRHSGTSRSHCLELTKVPAVIVYPAYLAFLPFTWPTRSARAFTSPTRDFLITLTMPLFFEVGGHHNATAAFGSLNAVGRSIVTVEYRGRHNHE